MLRSPIAYSGSKFSLLDQLLPLFPSKIDNFYDVFCGSTTVSLNVEANNYFCNDICEPLISLYEYLKNSYNEQELEKYIKKYDLYSLKENNYYFLRDEYNKTKNPLLLYILSRTSFNHLIRFNSNGEFNTPFGNGKFINISYSFLNKIKQINFFNKSFIDFLSLFSYNENDFIYLDPPYLITNASYNTLWNENEEKKLLDFCKNTKAKFGISNVFEHKGRMNEILKEFSKDFNVHILDKKYYSWESASKNKSEKTVEVYICNYDIENALDLEDW